MAARVNEPDPANVPYRQNAAVPLRADDSKMKSPGQSVRPVDSTKHRDLLLVVLLYVHLRSVLMMLCRMHVVAVR